MKVPEGENREQEIENLFEKIMTENFPNFVEEIDINTGNTERPKQDKFKEAHSKHIIIKMPRVKDKERSLKAAREKQRVTYKGFPIRRSAYFSKETLQARTGWQEVFNVMESKDLQP